MEVIEYLNQFRMKPTDAAIFDKNITNANLRKTIYHDYPVMAKLWKKQLSRELSIEQE